MSLQEVTISQPEISKRRLTFGERLYRRKLRELISQGTDDGDHIHIKLTDDTMLLLEQGYDVQVHKGPRGRLLCDDIILQITYGSFHFQRTTTYDRLVGKVNVSDELFDVEDDVTVDAVELIKQFREAVGISDPEGEVSNEAAVPILVDLVERFNKARIVSSGISAADNLT